MSYSQSLEEQHILDYFKQLYGNGFTGMLCDIGSADGKTMSNTYQLLLNGWEGVLVEPSAHLIPALIKNMQGLNAEIINSVVSLKAGWTKFYESNGDFLSTTNEKNVQIWKDVPFKPVMVYAVHFMALKERYGDVFDFINIDVEGNSAELFCNMFEHFPNCKLWCIEHDGRQEDILSLAQTKGFREILRNNENIIVVR